MSFEPINLIFQPIAPPIDPCGPRTAVEFDWYSLGGPVSGEMNFCFRFISFCCFSFAFDLFRLKKKRNKSNSFRPEPNVRRDSCSHPAGIESPSLQIGLPFAVFISLTCQHVVCHRRPTFRRRKMLNFYHWFLYFSTFPSRMTLRRIRNHGLQRTHGHGSRSSNGITHGHRNGLPVLVAAATFAGNAQRSFTAAAAWNILQRPEHIRRAVLTFHVQYVDHPIPLASHRSFLQRRKVRNCFFFLISSGRICRPISLTCCWQDALITYQPCFRQSARCVRQFTAAEQSGATATTTTTTTTTTSTATTTTTTAEHEYGTDSAVRRSSRSASSTATAATTTAAAATTATTSTTSTSPATTVQCQAGRHNNGNVGRFQSGAR